MAGYNTIYKPSIMYLLSATSLSMTQLDNIHSTLIPCLLPRMGYYRSFPRAVVFGSKYSGGIGIINFK
eukprot:3191879-Ditylum_brightwellii.AAC.1